MYEYWKKTGFNGVYPKGGNDELWSQVVSGRNYILKKTDTKDSLCIKFHETLEGVVSIEHKYL